MKNIIPPVKGTRDFYPEQMAMRTWLYDTVRAVSESFGYQEWEAPFLETIDLYAAKSGDELVNQQSYVFPDRGGDDDHLASGVDPLPGAHGGSKPERTGFPVALVVIWSVLALRTPADAAARASSSSGISTCSV